MKRFFLIPLAAAFLLGACGDSGEDNDTTTDNVDENPLEYSEMNEMSLKPHGLNMKFMVPDVASSTGAALEPQVIHEDGDYLWHVKIGKHFHMVIEDYGKEKDKVKNEKARLIDLNKIFVTEFLTDDANLIMYKRTLHDDQGGKPSYHVYGEILIGGYTYILRSEDEGSLKPIIEDMLLTIKSAKEIGAVDPA
ncbi:MAG: hypothetical protein ACI857_003259 [Arenicella sp.]|jgi:hypothetical protein